MPVLRYRHRQGLMAEWLGKGLQNLVQRFESASRPPLKPRCRLLQRGFSFVLYGICTAKDKFGRLIAINTMSLLH